MPKHYGIDARNGEYKDQSKATLRSLIAADLRRLGRWIAWRWKILIRSDVR